MLPQQAELFGRGLFNDPISKGTDIKQRMFCNYDALLCHGVARDFEEHWLVAHAFQVLDNMYDHNEYGAKALQTHIENGTPCPLAITPFADLSCLNSSQLLPLFTTAHDSSTFVIELGFRYCRTIVYPMHGRKPNWNPPGRNKKEIVHPNFFDVLDEGQLLCLDGNLADTMFDGPTLQVSRHLLMQTFIKIFDAFKLDNEGHSLVYLRNHHNHVITLAIPSPNGTDILEEFDLANENTFPSVSKEPNLFFMWLISVKNLATLKTDWNTLFGDDLDDEIFKVLQQLQHTNVALQKSEIFCNDHSLKHITIVTTQTIPT